MEDEGVDDDSAGRGLAVSVDGVAGSGFAASPSASPVDDGFAASPCASAASPDEGFAASPASPVADGFVDDEVLSHSSTKALSLGFATAFERATSRYLFLSSHSSKELESE